MNENLASNIIDVDKVKKQQKAMYILVTVLIYAFLAVMAIIIVFPFYWMIISSVKSLKYLYMFLL